MRAGLMALEKEGESIFLASVLESTAAVVAANRSSAYSGLERGVTAPEERLLFGGAEIGNETAVEINLIGTEAAMKVAGEFGVPKFKNDRGSTAVDILAGYQDGAGGRDRGQACEQGVEGGAPRWQAGDEEQVGDRR